MKNKKSITILMVAFTLASCQSYKRVPYLQSYESLTDKGYKEIVINEVNQQDTLYDARIQPKDLLSITSPLPQRDSHRHRTHVQLQNISYRRSEPSRYIYHQQRESKSL